MKKYGVHISPISIGLIGFGTVGAGAFEGRPWPYFQLGVEIFHSQAFLDGF